MIAYDIDGVFLGDMDFDGLGPNAHKTLLAVRHAKIKPIFQPIGDYYLATGRPVEDRPSTVNWIQMFFTNPPLKLFHENPERKEGNAEKYKLKVLEENPEIKLFVESSPEQVAYLRKNLKRNDIHVMIFRDFVTLSLELMRDDFMRKLNETQLIVPEPKRIVH